MSHLDLMVSISQSVDIVFDHTEHCMTNIFIKYVIYQAIREMVMDIIMESCEDKTFVSGTTLNFRELY